MKRSAFSQLFRSVLTGLVMSLAAAACGSDGNNGRDGGGNSGDCQPLPETEMVGIFVAVNGNADAAGTQADPIDLGTAFSDGSPAMPGDVLWIAEGTYEGSLVSSLSGAEDNPIIVRPHPGARVVIDTLAGDGLVINGRWTNYYDLEVMSSAGDRESVENSSGPSDLTLGGGIGLFGPNIKMLNVEVHDTTGGYGFWRPSISSEIYGNIIYNNGWTAPGRGHGHAI